MIKKQYNFICSLGANCSASHQLKYRNMRYFALPFDWTWYNSSEAVDNISDGFKNHFKNFMQKDKLRKLNENEYSKWHSDRYQYEDTATKVYYFNHFYKTDNEEEEKTRVIMQFRKRCNRLYDMIEKADNVLMILSCINEIDEKSVLNLVNTLKTVFPNTNIDVLYQAFGCSENKQYELDNLEVRLYKREENLYEYTQTNFEWNFLDNISIEHLTNNSSDNNTNELVCKSNVISANFEGGGKAMFTVYLPHKKRNISKNAT